MRRAESVDLGTDLDTVLDLLDARFGPGIVARLTSMRLVVSAPAVPSGSLALDLATGIGGLPRGGLTELVGLDTSGKTTLLYSALAAVQRDGGLAALIDTEGSVLAEALLSCGVDLDELLLVRPASAPDAWLLLTILARCRGLDALGFSSISALRDLPAGNLRSATDHSLAAYDLGRLMARGLRVLFADLADSPTAIIMTNEPLSPVHQDGAAGVRSGGGRALAHFASLRVLLEPLDRLPDPTGGTKGLRVAATIVKSKCGPSGRRAELTILRERGIDTAEELLRFGVATGTIEWHPLGFIHGGALLGRSERAVARCLGDDPALAAAVRADIIAAHRDAS